MGIMIIIKSEDNLIKAGSGSQSDSNNPNDVDFDIVVIVDKDEILKFRNLEDKYDPHDFRSRFSI